MLKLSAIILGSVSLCAMAHAQTPPIPSHIMVVVPSPTKRTTVVGVVGQPTTFTFPKGQSIYRVVQTGKPANGGIADAGWSAPGQTDVHDAPLGNNLPLWPILAGESTMTVITMTDDGVQTIYPFKLIAKESDASDANDVTYNLIFDGKGQPVPQPSPTVLSGGAVVTQVAAPARVWTKKRQADLQEAQEHIRTDAFNGADGECHYHAKGKKDTAIKPLCPMDNGEWTMIRFPGLSKKPAVYIATGQDGKDERLARQHSSGDFVVIEEIAKTFTLHLDKDVLQIINDGYDPAGKPSHSGTISATVQREILQAKTQ